MFVICDDKNKVQDKASHEANLSRGYLLAGVSVGDDVALSAVGYHKYEITKSTDIRILDTYDGVKVTKNVKNRSEIELIGVKRSIVEESVKKDKAVSLGFTDVEQEHDNELTALNLRKTELEAIIAITP
jgi:hypothetical protein